MSVTPGTFPRQNVIYGSGSLTTCPYGIGEKPQFHRISNGEYLGIRGLIDVIYLYEALRGFDRIGQKIQVRLIADGNDNPGQADRRWK
jgi:hypothetical protein